MPTAPSPRTPNGNNKQGLLLGLMWASAFLLMKELIKWALSPGFAPHPLDHGDMSVVSSSPMAVQPSPARRFTIQLDEAQVTPPAIQSQQAAL